MLTIREEDDVVFEALRAGASGYLLKNAPPDRVVAAVEEAHRGGVPMTGSIARKVLHLFREQSTPGVDYGLTAREVEILQLLVDGLKLRQIAEKLFLSRHTVDSHIRNIIELCQGGLTGKGCPKTLFHVFSGFYDPHARKDIP